ncbi:hypothetical protein KV557_24455 [Kitasatospora aureofaciens]|uniref:DUF6192 family protein n=1 Tax=Kitasatospora aureofaciens TaxID=1894 RepID=UPI001C4745FB|nr:DUF6192 family protein [Kitasatospora aureofaciens]MBV6700216.1 hypothetical protein [Kitasatospora aureofaciens]
MATSSVDGYGANEWDQLVHRGQRLVASEGSSQFALGDIGLEMVPLPPKGRRPPMKAYKLLATYAEEVGLESERFEEYRLVAGAWPKKERAKNVCWTVHSILAHRHDRFEMVKDPPIYRRTGERRWTCDGAHRALGWKTQVPETMEEKVRQIEDLLDDETAVEVVERAMRRPEVVKRVAASPQVRETFNRAQASEIREAREETRRRPEVQRLNEQQEVLTVLGLCSAFASGIGRTLPGLHLAELSEDAQDSIREGLGRVKAAVEWTEHVLETGRTDMDAALERLIAGES